ncbi:MAG: hypothetical protein J4428_03480 [Candidatus Aenigmarchaeota archaeon]|nr:hypothetical protein [Candidatus Aenigmarchaeota archaeon]
MISRTNGKKPIVEYKKALVNVLGYARLPDDESSIRFLLFYCNAAIMYSLGIGEITRSEFPRKLDKYYLKHRGLYPEAYGKPSEFFAFILSRMAIDGCTLKPNQIYSDNSANGSSTFLTGYRRVNYLSRIAKGTLIQVEDLEELPELERNEKLDEIIERSKQKIRYLLGDTEPEKVLA